MSEANQAGNVTSIQDIFDGEVVTHALVRDVQLPHGAGTLALITLDNGHDHTKPSTFGPAGLAELNEALDSVAARDDLVAVGVTGKPFIFAVGADLKGVPLVQDRLQAKAIGKLGHDVFRRLGELSVPTFMLDEGVVAAREDIDLCMILGAGRPVPPGRRHAVPGPHRHRREGHRQPLRLTGRSTRKGRSVRIERLLSCISAGQDADGFGPTRAGDHFPYESAPTRENP